MAEEKKAPELTSEQKLRAVLAHREYIKAEAENKLAQLKVQTTLNELSNVVDQIGIELNLEKGKYTVNLDQLTLTEIAKG